MDYTDQQNKALEAIKEFLDGENSVFILKGYAGTGKTTLVAPVVKLAQDTGRDCLLMAPTGRAAKILGEKSGQHATTIHKAIYKFSSLEVVSGSERKESRVMYRYPLKKMDKPGDNEPGLDSESTLIIVDEASMVSAVKQCSDIHIFGSGNLLKDLIKYAGLNSGGKILFIGDPCQLPPVNDQDSCALDLEYFEDRGIQAESFELTEVVRQAADSALLGNSIKLREVMGSRRKGGLVMERKGGEVEDIGSDEIPRRFCEISPEPSLDGPVVICFTNRQAAEYNEAIRKILFPRNNGMVQVGDRLIVVGNNYVTDGRAVLNGEQCTVVGVSKDVETLVGPVYADTGEEKKKCIKVELSFRDISLLFEDGVVVNTKILDNLLNSTNGSITAREQNALMSNFNIRHDDLERNSREYLDALMHDPYYNAVRVKYGYAITCHKAQGGEWDTTFVDFKGREGLNVECLRWSYTALTRARKNMYAHCLHNIPVFKTRVTRILTSSVAPAEFYPSSLEVPTGPFHDYGDSAPVKAKYWQVIDALEGSGYHVAGIEHKPYREIYSIADMDGNTFECHATYNRAGIMRPFHSEEPDGVPEDVLALVNSGELPSFPFTYNPSNQNLRELYLTVRSACDEFGITITNIVEHLGNYLVLYFMRTDAAFASLNVWVNKYGQITYIEPRSQLGAEDEKLSQLVDAISK